MRRPLPQGVEEEDVRDDDILVRSPLSGRLYIVSRWVEQEGGRCLALDKRSVDEEEVPDEVLASIDSLDDVEQEVDA